MSESLLIFGESNDSYHANPCASSSKITKFAQRGPRFYQGRYITGEIEAEEKTDALRLGCAIDSLVTVGVEDFDRQYILKPDGMSFATKEGKAWRDAHCRGKSIITADEWQMIQRVHKAVLAHPLYPVLIHPKVKSQVTVRKPSTKYGVGLQCRPDWLSLEPCALSLGRPYSVNLKTTADWRDWFDEGDVDGPRQGSPIYTYGYHRQAALDQWCLFQSPDVGETSHFIIVVEKEEPYRVGIVQLTEQYCEMGWYETEADLVRLAECYKTNVWPNGQDKIISIGPPKWLVDRAMKKAIA